MILKIYDVKKWRNVEVVKMTVKHCRCNGY